MGIGVLHSLVSSLCTAQQNCEYSTLTPGRSYCASLTSRFHSTCCNPLPCAHTSLKVRHFASDELSTDEWLYIKCWRRCRIGGAIWPPAVWSSATALFPYEMEGGRWRNGYDAAWDDRSSGGGRGIFVFIYMTRNKFKPQKWLVL
jgi:hypothetical protein